MALREVNLIPAGLLFRRGAVRHVCFWGVCLLVALGMIFGFLVYQKRAILARQPALQSLEEIQLHLGQRVSEINRIQAELQRLDQQRAVLDKITRNRSYCQVLWKLTDIFNDETWLTQLSIDRNPPENRAIRLGLTGLSFSNATLGNFINQISSEPMFNDVQLVYAKEGNRQISKTNSGNRLKLIQFEIESIIINQVK
jgi:Tfp pilus assembly protein PilN